MYTPAVRFRTSTVVTTSLLLLGVGGVFAVFGDTIRAALAPVSADVGAPQPHAAGSPPSSGDQTSTPTTTGTGDAGPARGDAGTAR